MRRLVIAGAALSAAYGALFLWFGVRRLFDEDFGEPGIWRKQADYFKRRQQQRWDDHMARLRDESFYK